MDKLYKSFWIDAVKAGMREVLPDFSSVSVPKEHRHRDIFSGSLLYSQVVQANAVLWVDWSPDPGVERRFNVMLGWSPAVERFPCVREHDRRVYSLRGPTPELDAASLDLEQIEGRTAMGGIVIPSPWDQLLLVKAAAPKKEMDAMMRKAYLEATALTKEERASSVRNTVVETLARIAVILPRFRAELLAQKSVA